jgi:hypothetical protein
MSIALACPKCATSVPLTADMAGKRAKCPECLMALAVPSALAELPDRAGPSAVPVPKAASRLGTAGTILAWVLGLGAAAVLLIAFCSGAAGLAIYWMSHGSEEANRLAANVVVHPAGADLPAGAPKRAMRVTEFHGVFQVKAQINNTDVVFKNQGGGVNNNKRCKEYVIDLEAGKSYTIDLESRDFDSYLRLENISGPVIREDDDSGGNLNSRIQFIPPLTASYVVVATSLGGGNGSFTLTVRDTKFARPR